MVSPILLSLWMCGDTLDPGTECPLGIGTAREGLFRGKRAQGRLLEKLNPQQGLEGWRVWGLDSEEEEEGKALLEAAPWDQSQGGQPSYSFIIHSSVHSTPVLQALQGVPGQ